MGKAGGGFLRYLCGVLLYEWLRCRDGDGDREKKDEDEEEEEEEGEDVE